MSVALHRNAHMKEIIYYASLFTGLILLVLKLSTFLAKLHSGWHVPQSWPQPIHVHVHNSHPYAHPNSYWEPVSAAGSEDYYYKG